MRKLRQGVYWKTDVGFLLYQIYAQYWHHVSPLPPPEGFALVLSSVLTDLSGAAACRKLVAGKSLAMHLAGAVGSGGRPGVLNLPRGRTCHVSWTANSLRHQDWCVGSGWMVLKSFWLCGQGPWNSLKGSEKRKYKIQQKSRTKGNPSILAPKKHTRARAYTLRVRQTTD